MFSRKDVGEGGEVPNVRVGDVDIVQLEVGGLNTKRGRLVIAEAVRLRQTVRDGHLVGRVGGVVLGVAVDGQLGAAGGDEYLFVVFAWLDEDALFAGRRGGQRVHGGLDGAEGSVGADRDTPGGCAGPAGRQHGGREGEEDREGLHGVCVCLCVLRGAGHLGDGWMDGESRESLSTEDIVATTWLDLYR